jgi:hypothetical protein
MKPASLPTFALLAMLLPPGLLLRSALLVPLGAIVPALRKLVWERASALSINPAFRRRPPEGALARMVFWQELGASAWAIALLAASWTWGWRPLLIAMAVVSVTAVLNQVRTLVAHLWINEGEPMTVTSPSCGRRSACAITPPTTCCRRCRTIRWPRRIAGYRRISTSIRPIIKPAMAGCGR